MILMLMWLLAIIVFVFIDLIIKAYIEKLYYKNELPKQFGPIRITYIVNRGMAFGFLKGKNVIIYSVIGASILCIFAILVYILLFHYEISVILGITLMLSGGLGNFIGRIRKKGVIDYIALNIKKCPIFNLADLYVWIGSIIVLCYSFQNNIW